MRSGERRATPVRADEGFVMAAMLVAIAVMLVAMTAALPVMSTAARREKEAELIFRGKQYARAIGAFQRKYGGTSPTTIDLLVTERFLRKKFKDPITNEDFVLVTPDSALPTTSSVPGLPAGTSTAGRSTGSSTTGSRTGGTSTTTSIASTGRASSAMSSTTTSGSSGATGLGTQAGATLGIMGVRSKSKEKGFRTYNGLEHYDEWVFMGTQAAARVGSPAGGQTPGGTRGGAAGGRGGQTGAQPQGGRGGGAGGGRGAAPPPPPPPPSPFGPR